MLNVAIIGTGNIAPAHVHGFLQFDDRCKVVAMVDIYPEKAQAMNERFGLGAEVYDSHEKLFARDDIDLVSICTPPYTHADIAVSCMQNGMDVLCEKPMASSLAECDRMIAAQDESGRRLSIISQNRFRTPSMKLKQLLDSGVAGKVLHAQVDSLWWRGQSYFDLWWRGTWEKEGGGCTLNHAVHHIDMMTWMMGLPVELTAVINNLNHTNSEVEDFSVTISKYASGAMSTLTSSLVHHGEEQVMSFQCEKAKVSAPWHIIANRSKPNGFWMDAPETQQEIEQAYEALPSVEHEGHVGQIEDVLNGIEQGTDFLVTAEDGRRTLEFITAVYKSGFSAQTVTLPLAKDDPFYTVAGIQTNVRKFHEKSTSVENFDADEITL